MASEQSLPEHLKPVHPWSYSRSSTTPQPSSPSATATEEPPDGSSSSPGDPTGREADIAAWVQACVALVPAVITLVVSFGIDMTNEQQLAATSLAGALGTMALLTWRTFRARRNRT